MEIPAIRIKNVFRLKPVVMASVKVKLSEKLRKTFIPKIVLKSSELIQGPENKIKE